MIRGPGVTAEATHWLYDRGVRVMGIDAWGWDRPLNLQARRRSSATRPASSGRPTRPTSLLADRAAGQPRPAAADRLHGRLLPAADRGASAAPARVVAIFD